MAAAAREKYGFDEIEFYGVSCVGVSELCQTFDIKSYPSVFAIAAGASVAARENMGYVSSFSLEKVETMFKLTAVERRTEDFEGDKESNADDEERGNDEREDDEEDNSGLGGAPEASEEEEESNEIPGGEELQNETGDDASGNARDDQQSGEPDEEIMGWEEIPKVIPMRKVSGADLARDMPRSMDKWKEIQMKRLREKEHKWPAKRKSIPGSPGTEVSDHPGATAIMMANRKGTDEFHVRQSDLQNIIERMQTARHRNRGQTVVKQGRSRPPFKKRLSAPRLVERLPVIKRIVVMTVEEELILDASLSFLEGLRVSVFKSKEPLPLKQKRALKGWLDLLSISLPPEWALHETIGDLVENIDRISMSHQDLMNVLEKHTFPRIRWSRTCAGQDGFSCGFWRLLHVMTVGVAEHRGGRDLIDSSLVRPGTRVFSPIEAAETLREYVVYFFPCTQCAQHFASQFDICENNRRCDRLTKDLSTASDADWKELAKWLWEFHNDVSVRILKDKLGKRHRRSAEPNEALLADQVGELWPTVDECVVCFYEDGTYNEEAIFLHLEKVYW